MSEGFLSVFPLVPLLRQSGMGLRLPSVSRTWNCTLSCYMPSGVRLRPSTFQRWNPTAEKLEQDPDRKGLTAEQVHQVLQKLGTLCKDNIITKFNSVRETKKEPEQNEKAVFTVEVAPGSKHCTEVDGATGQLHVMELSGSTDAPTTQKNMT